MSRRAAAVAVAAAFGGGWDADADFGVAGGCHFCKAIGNWEMGLYINGCGFVSLDLEHYDEATWSLPLAFSLATTLTII